MVKSADLFELNSDAAFAIDRSLKIVGWNNEAVKCLGFSADEVVGRYCSDVMQIVHSHGEPLCVHSCEAVRCFRRHQNFSALSCYARHKDGEWIPVSLTSTAMPDQGQEIDTNSPFAVIYLNSKQEHVGDLPDVRALQIFTFGHFGLVAGGRSLSIEHWPRKQALTLLKILVTRFGRTVPSDLLSECLWPEIDEHRGRERLKVTIYALRRELRAAGLSEEVIETAGEGYLLRREAIWVDAEVFENCIAEGADHQSRQNWEEAIHSYTEAQRLYRGDYMEEISHSDWCVEERYRLHEVHLDMLTNIAECHAACGRLDEAASICRTILVTDPCRESIHRELMEYLVRSGHTDSAIAQYHHCQQIMADEIGVDPMPETEQLYQQIITGEATAVTEKSDQTGFRYSRFRHQ